VHSLISKLSDELEGQAYRESLEAFINSCTQSSVHALFASLEDSDEIAQLSNIANTVKEAARGGIHALTRDVRRLLEGRVRQETV
jgi:hypothetical protein